MHFCKAQISIGGDKDNIYYANEFDPISWPEVLVLQALHGQDAVEAVEPFARVDMSSREERARLNNKYKDTILSQVFGGSQGPNEMEAPGVKLRGGITWKNPITQDLEVTGGAVAPEEIAFDETPPPAPTPKMMAAAEQAQARRR